MKESTLLSPVLGLSLLAGFIVLWIALGAWWGRRAKSLDGFMLANRNVGLALGSATAVATWITSNTTMLAPEFALQLGIWGMLAYCTASFGLFLFAPMAQRIRRLMPKGYTSSQFMRLRFGETAGSIFLAYSLFYSLTWLVSMAMAGGNLLEALSGIPYSVGMSMVLFACVFYTLFGGLYAVIGTDFIQSIIILIGLVVVAVAVHANISVGEVYETIRVERPALLWVLFPAALMSVFNNMLFGLGEIFHSNVWWSRAFAMRGGVGFRAYLLAGVIWLPVPVVAGFLGLAAPALGINVTRPDMAAPLVAGVLLGKFGSVLVFVIIFASLASSIDSLLAATSDLVTTDVYHRWLKPDASAAELRRFTTVAIVTVGVLTWLICLPRVGTLATVLFFAGPLVGAMIWPVLAGLYWKSANPKGINLAMILGGGAGLVSYLELGWYTGALVGTAVSMLVVVVATRFSPRQFRWEDLREQPAPEPKGNHVS